MLEAPTLSNAPLPHPGMDYAFLRQEGIKLIAKLAGSQWTDYNTHDPGITILEAWCYALTDLSYRLDFAMEDLLAFPPGESAPPLFLSAREGLTTNPLTLNDYRKLLIDIDGVKNAWLEPIAAPNPAIYYDAKNAKLTFINVDSLNIAEPVHLRGLYRVLLEPDNILTEKNRGQTQLVTAAKTKLHQHRNLCEDFAEIVVLQAELITVRAELEIADHVDPHQLLAQLHLALDRAISPTLDFVDLHELLAQGIPAEEIFAGPQLAHGFIDEAQLQQFDRKTELRTSDLIHVILDLEQVKTVRTITLSSGQSATPQPWVLDLNPELTPRLKQLEAMIGDITLYKGQIPCPVDSTKVQAALHKLVSAQTAPQPTVQDLPIPTGNYRALADYESLQSEFPLVYGIGEVGLPSSASPLRKAQVKQLQAYLMVFDQLLANYFAQLDQVRSLFNPSNAEVKSYFTQSIAHFPGASDILTTSHDVGTTETEHQKTDEEKRRIERDRKNRLLEHLVAQYGESFIDYSLLYGNNTLPTAAIAHKAAFAANYRLVSAGRAQGFNYRLHPGQTNNISGFKRRVARLLGIAPERRSLKTNDKTAAPNVEGFYVIEHILLRPRPNVASGKTDASKTARDTTQSRNDLLSFSQRITAFTPSGSGVICTCEQHGLQPGEAVSILYSSTYNGTYLVQAEGLDKHRFTIDAPSVPHHSPDRDAWVRVNQHPDPFSFQISVVLPNWPQRFGRDSFRQLVYNTLTAEVPAHITLRLHWLDPDQMNTFEVMHDLWLQDLSGTTNDSADAQTAAQAASKQLIDFLGLGSTDVPPIPSLVGYMTISDKNKKTPTPDFVVF